MQLLEGKFASSTEKRESFEKPINHTSSKNDSSQSKYSGNNSRTYKETDNNLMDSLISTNNMNDSYGSGKSFPRGHSRRQTPEYNTGEIVPLIHLVEKILW